MRYILYVTEMGEFHDTIIHHEEEVAQEEEDVKQKGQGASDDSTSETLTDSFDSCNDNSSDINTNETGERCDAPRKRTRTTTVTVFYTYDDILKIIGDFGSYQKQQYFFLCLITIVSAFHAFNMVFVGATPYHYCNVDRYRDNFNYSEETLLNLTIPYSFMERNGKMTYCECDQYNISDPDILNDPREWEWIPSNSSIVKCMDGWQYDNIYYEATIVTEVSS